MQKAALDIQLPMPDKQLLPNQERRQSHWSQRSRVTKHHRERAMVEAMAADHQPVQHGRIHVHFYFPDRRRRDLINFLHALKPYIDGIVDAGVIPDDDNRHLAVGSVTWSVAETESGVRITILEDPEVGARGRNHAHQ